MGSSVVFESDMGVHPVGVQISIPGRRVMDKSHVWSLWGCTAHMVLVAVFSAFRTAF